MPTCEKCGFDLPKDAAFCPNCAQPIAQPGAGTDADSGLQTLSGLETVVPDGPTDSPPQSVLQAGEVFHERYSIEQKLGEGAMGVVYLAADKVTGRQVALKLINPARVKSDSAVQRFIREGLTSRDIRHPNVIAMYDVGDDQGQLYLVMEYLEGETLRGWLHRNIRADREIPFNAVRDVVSKILEGLKAAHDTDIIHRDLKPENIMLIGDPEGGDYKLKILDFGIARAINAAPSTLTTTGTATGTPLYMAPEQRTAADTVGPPADLYAVSAIFYELLMGVTPEGRLGQPSREREDVPAAVDAIIEKGLSSRPRSRYQSAGDYLTDLQQLEDRREETEYVPKEPRKQEKSDTPRETKSDNFWNKLSRKQQIAVIIAAILFGIIGSMEEGGYFTPDPEYPVPPAMDITAVEPYRSVEPVAAPPHQPTITSREPNQATVSFAGRWYDQLLGNSFAHAYVDIQQQGNSISGVVYDTQDNRMGTISGHVDGNSLEYEYQVFDGRTGWGSGQLRPDTTHLDLVVTDNSAGTSEAHVLHRGHLPGM